MDYTYYFKNFGVYPTNTCYIPNEIQNIRVFSEKTDVPPPPKLFYGGSFKQDLLWPWK